MEGKLWWRCIVCKKNIFSTKEKDIKTHCEGSKGSHMQRRNKNFRDHPQDCIRTDG